MHRGDTGEPVQRLHEHLRDLGYSPLADPPTVYGDATAAVIEAFQRSRGLAITGEVDEVTWSRLIEAGWHFGQRLLYFAQPHLRGDDVAELQVRLAQLGFNPGRIDGIFGTQTASALVDFQRNRALAADGALDRATFQELIRMTARQTERHLVTEARDLAGFDALGSGPLVIYGDSPLARLVAAAAHATFEVEVETAATCEELAAFANARGALAVLSFEFKPTLNGVHLHYWANYHSHSRRGEQLASALATGLVRARELPRVEVTGMALPILRETKMTTLHIEHGEHDDVALHDLAEVFLQVLTQVFHRNHHNPNGRP